MTDLNPGGVNLEALEAFLRADYAAKDTMHDLTHVRRVHRAAVRLAAATGQRYDERVLAIGAYLHGVVYLPDRQRAAQSFLRAARVPEAVIEAGVQAARESQTDSVPTTAEGVLLHDGHLLEGGLSFLLVKTLVTGGARGSTLAEIVEFWEQHVAGAFRCTLPAAQLEYAAQERFARAVFEELRQDVGTGTGSPAA
jgi:uncharacterized protein